MKLIIIVRLLMILLLFGAPVFGQNWNNKQCAVVLTYDDALNVHLDNVIPSLDSHNLKGTFYLTVSSKAFTTRIEEWKKVAENKHELANHTLFHPCNGSLPGRSFVKPEYDLSNYSVSRIIDELQMTNTVLHTVDGKIERTFAYPCGDMLAGGLSYTEELKKYFVAARGVNSIVEKMETMDLYNVGSFMINGRTGKDLINLVKQAMDSQGLVVFLFHGVGGDHSLDVSLEAHDKLLRFLKSHEDKIWVPTLLEVASYLKETKPKK